MENTFFDEVVIDLRDEQLRGGTIIPLLAELDGCSADALVLHLHRVADDVLPRVVAVARFLGEKRRVKITGLRGKQIHIATALGLGLQEILIGYVPRSLPAAR